MNESVAVTAPAPGVVDRLIDEVARLATTAAGRIAQRLPFVAVLAAIAGLVVWGSLGGALLDEGGDWTWASLALAVACVIPVALVMINWRRLRKLSMRESELRDDLHGLVGSVRDQASAFTSLDRVRAELAERRLGIRGLIDVGRAIRRWTMARGDTSDRSTALVEAFGLVGWTGVGVCLLSLLAVVVAVPVAIVAGSAVWAT
jgi:hypothetical protein